MKVISKLNDCILYQKNTINCAIKKLTQPNTRTVFITNNNDNYIGCITDGDIRRALINKVDLNQPVINIVNKTSFSICESEVKTIDCNYLISNNIFDVPIIKNKKITSFLQLKPFDSLENTTIVIQAGGLGSRLHPLTENCPKPMLKIGARPLLEHLILQLKSFHAKNFYISVHYLSEKIIEFFQDGKNHNINIEYLEENQRLGTAGPLGLLAPNKISENFLLLNGDIASEINFLKLTSYHSENNFDLTICARKHNMKVPYGVINSDDLIFKSIDEKPVISFLINAGVYCINKKLLPLIPKDEYFDMNTFIDIAKSKNFKIGIYPLHEYWVDIGQLADLDKVRNDWT